MKYFLLLAVLVIGGSVYSQNDFSGIVLEQNTSLPVEGASVFLLPNNQITLTDERGKFFFKSYNASSIIKITSIGHESITLPLAELIKSKNIIRLRRTTIQLSNVTVSAGANDQYRPIGKLDIKMRGINNSQEVLRMVPDYLSVSMLAVERQNRFF